MTFERQRWDKKCKQLLLTGLLTIKSGSKPLESHHGDMGRHLQFSVLEEAAEPGKGRRNRCKAAVLTVLPTVVLLKGTNGRHDVCSPR